MNFTVWCNKTNQSIISASLVEQKLLKHVTSPSWKNMPGLQVTEISMYIVYDINNTLLIAIMKREIIKRANNK